MRGCAVRVGVGSQGMRVARNLGIARPSFHYHRHCQIRRYIGTSVRATAPILEWPLSPCAEYGAGVMPANLLYKIKQNAVLTAPSSGSGGGGIVDIPAVAAC